MVTPYPASVTLITNGEAVEQGVINRPLGQLTQRTAHLSQRMEQAELGSILVDWQASIDPSAVEGMALYLDNDLVYRPALAATTLSPDGTTLTLANTGRPVGMLQYRHSPTRGDVVLRGRLAVTAARLASLCLNGVVATGQLFLSATPGQSGLLTPQSPPLGVPVAFCAGPDANGDYLLIVAPQARDPFNAHIHYHARLSAEVAPDPGDPGWEVAGVGAPASATHRYVMESDPLLSLMWPPIPLAAVHYDIDGVAADLVANDRVLINEEGIWWTDISDGPAGLRHDFYFLRMTFRNNDNAVTALTALDDSITLTNRVTGVDAVTGSALTGPVGLRATFAATTTHNAEGIEALKSVAGQEFQFGPVLAGVRSDNTDLLTVTGTAHPTQSGYKHGLVTLSPAAAAENRGGQVEFVALDNAALTAWQGIYFYELKHDRVGSFRGRIMVPTVGLSGDYSLTLELMVLARAAGTPPDLTFSTRVVIATAGPEALPTTDIELTDIPLSAVGALTLNQYVTVTAPAITPVAPGDLVYFTVSREVAGGLSGSLGVLSVRWTLTVPATSP